MKNEAAYRYNRLSANSGSKIELDGQHYSTSSVDGTGDYATLVPFTGSGVRTLL